MGVLSVAEIDVKCNACSRSLDADFGRRAGELYVDFCDKCEEDLVSAAKKEGYSEGYEEGYLYGVEAAEGRYDQEMINWVKVKDRLTS